MKHLPVHRLRPFASLRLSHSLSLTSAAVRLNLSARYLRSLETGTVPLSPYVAQKMANLYECPISQLTRPAGRAGEPGGGHGSRGNEPCPVSGDDWATAEDLGLTEKQMERRYPWAEPRLGNDGRRIWNRMELGLQAFEGEEDTDR